MGTPSTPTPKRILVIRWKCIGDVLFTLPATEMLRENYPDAEITYFVSRENRFLMEGFEAVDQVWTLDRNALRGRGFARELLSLAGLVLRLRRTRFSLVVDFQGYGETAWLTRWSGAPVRLGFTHRASRRPAYTRSFDLAHHRHTAELYTSGLAETGLRLPAAANRFRLDQRHDADARRYLADHRIPSGQALVYLQPFGSDAARCWPLDRYLTLAQLLRERGATVLFGAGPDERKKLAGAAAAGFHVIDGLPRMTDIGLLGMADLVVGGETGFLHLAAALGRRTIMPGTSGSVWPYGHPDWRITSPDDRLTGIPVERIWREAEIALAEAPQRPRP